jgi:hypothetical protein
MVRQKNLEPTSKEATINASSSSSSKYIANEIPIGTRLVMPVKKDGPFAGIILMIFGIGYPYYMYPTWANLAPMSIGKFHHLVITWDANPKLYSISVALTVLGSVCAFIYGYSCVFRRKNERSFCD